MSRVRKYQPVFSVCKFDVETDFAQTVQGAAITPRQIAELADRGIPVTPQAVEREIQGNSEWFVEPMFRRGMDMAKAWEMEQNAQRTARYALARQKHSDFVERIKMSD